MSRKPFTEKQLLLLRQNPYVYSVTGSRLLLTREFKELFLASYQAGESPRKILEDHGFDVTVLGESRVWSISQHIRDEYRKYGEFHEGYRKPSSAKKPDSQTASHDGEQRDLEQLRHEVEYLRQEMEFLKKISSIRTTGK